MTNDPLLHHAERLRRDAAALERSAAIEPPEMRPTPYHQGALRVVPDGLPPPDAEGLGEESAERIIGLADGWERGHFQADDDRPWGDVGDPATVEWGGPRVVADRPPVEGLDPGSASEPPGAAWPDPPAPAAYHGLAGDLVGAVREHTEADPVAILGCCCGHGRTFYQGSPQAADLFVALVGDSSVGRKGTGHHVASAMFDAAWPEWHALLVPGLGSGEGLIGHLKRSEGEEHRALVLGRRPGLTPEITAAVLAAVRVGAPLEVAAQAAGVAPRTFWDWMRRGDEGKRPYAEFSESARRSEAEVRVRVVALAAVGAEADPARPDPLGRSRRLAHQEVVLVYDEPVVISEW